MSDMTDGRDTPRVSTGNYVPAAISGETPLQGAGVGAAAAAMGVAGQWAARELEPMGHLLLRCSGLNPAQCAAFERAMGTPLPIDPLQSAVAQTATVRWLSPDEWLISVPAHQTFEIESALHREMPGHYALVDNSGGLTVLELSGPKVVELLKRCVPVDLHLRRFPEGKVVSTVFAKHQAIVHRRAEDRFELVTRRSFAVYVWRWIEDIRL